MARRKVRSVAPLWNCGLAATGGGAAGEQFVELVATWDELVSVGRRLEALRLAAAPEARVELVGHAPHATDFQTFVWSLTRFAAYPDPLGAHTLPALRQYVPHLGQHVVEGSETFDGITPFRFHC